MNKWIKTAADRAAIEQGCYFDEKAALHVANFFERYLRHPLGRQWRGRPFKLLDWQYNEIIAPLFGWKNKDGTRRYRRAYISMGKKNGKTTLSSGIALYVLMEEPGSECYSVATSRDQAGYIYRNCAAMVRASELKAVLNPINTTKTVTYEDQNSFFRALSANANSAEGLNANLCIYDELHVAPNRDLFDALIYAGAAREQPLFISITTAGFDKNSICYEQYSYAKKIKEGLEDITFFPYIAEADIDDDWTKEETWKKANPSWGVTIDPEQFKQDYLAAKDSNTKENVFKRYRLNMWTRAETNFFNMEKWDACNLNLKTDHLENAECYAGLDLSNRVDISALVLLFPIRDEDEDIVRYDVLPYYWIPEEFADAKERKDGVPYRAWEDAGHLKTTPGNIVDQGFIRKQINELGDKFNIRKIACDDWNASKIMTELDQDGFEIVNFRQGYRSLSEPTKDLEALVLDEKLNHFGCPVLRWMASNTVAESDAAGNIKPSKKRSKEKIDGIAALVSALGIFNLDAGQSGSVYDDAGIQYF